MTVTVTAAHEHTWQLQAVHLEDGVALEEFGCACGAIDFR